MKASKHKNKLGTLNSERSIEISNFIIECNKNGIFEMAEIISDFEEYASQYTTNNFTQKELEKMANVLQLTEGGLYSSKSSPAFG